MAQFATPAELLMSPADEFVEDFVGADRALKRLALMRVSDIDLWEAPLAYVGQPTAEVRAKLAGAEIPYPLLVDEERRPIGWLSQRDLESEYVPARPDSPLGPVLEGADIMRDALADLLQGQSQYAAVIDSRGRIAGVLSIEIISDFLGSPAAEMDEQPARPRGRMRERRGACPCAAIEFRERGGRCEENPKALFCFDWARNNIDRYETPTVQHLQLVIAAVVLGFAIAFALALLAHRRRWLQPPLLAATGVLYTIPSVAFFFLLLPLTGRGVDTAIIALTAFNLQIIYRNTLVGLANVPASVRDAARGMGLTDRQLLWRVEVPLATPEIIAGLRIATVSTIAIATLAVFVSGWGLGDRSTRASTSRPGSSWEAGSRS